MEVEDNLSHLPPSPQLPCLVCGEVIVRRSAFLLDADDGDGVVIKQEDNQGSPLPPKSKLEVVQSFTTIFQRSTQATQWFLGEFVEENKFPFCGECTNQLIQIEELKRKLDEATRILKETLEEGEHNFEEGHAYRADSRYFKIRRWILGAKKVKDLSSSNKVAVNNQQTPTSEPEDATPTRTSARRRVSKPISRFGEVVDTSSIKITEDANKETIIVKTGGEKEIEIMTIKKKKRDNLPTVCPTCDKPCFGYTDMLLHHWTHYSAEEKKAKLERGEADVITPPCSEVEYNIKVEVEPMVEEEFIDEQEDFCQEQGKGDLLDIKISADPLSLGPPPSSVEEKEGELKVKQKSRATLKRKLVELEEAMSSEDDDDDILENSSDEDFVPPGTALEEEDEEYLSDKESKVTRRFDATKVKTVTYFGITLTRHDKKNYQCSSCLKLIPNVRTDLKHHVTSKHTRLYECSYCGKALGSEKGLKWHEQKCKDMPRECPTCGKPFSRHVSMISHQWSHYNEEERRAKLESGEKLPPNVEKKFQCDQCPRLFSTQSNLDSHLRTVHATEEERNKAKVLCTECGASVINIQDHMKRVHSEMEKKFQCSDCGKEFDAFPRLVTHRKMVHAERKWKCELCPKDFPIERLLKQHMKCHLNIRAFPCEHCPNIAFTTKHHLERHNRIFHEEGATPKRGCFIRGPEKKNMEMRRQAKAQREAKAAK